MSPVDEGRPPAGPEGGGDGGSDQGPTSSVSIHPGGTCRLCPLLGCGRPQCRTAELVGALEPLVEIAETLADISGSLATLAAAVGERTDVQFGTGWRRG